MADHAAAEQVNINYSLVIKREHIIIEREAAAFRNLGEKFSTTAQYRVKENCISTQSKITRCL